MKSDNELQKLEHRPFRRIAVLGAGTMGSQIAAHFANAGLEVLLLDIAPGDGAPNDVVQKLFAQARKLSPNPFFSSESIARITLGNFNEDFEAIADADWVVEVVVERMQIKRQVMERIERHARPDAVISTNTSGLPISEIAEGRSADFRRRFLGTHFFNPPRYLRLLEVIPTGDTSDAVVERVSEFARVHLGKGIVLAKDRPYFIGNRVGIFGLLGAIREFTDNGYTIEEVDLLTGPIVGRPRSATFRTADVVGLDVMLHVIENLHDAVPDDESVDAFKVPAILSQLVSEGALGAKTRAGFYKKEGDEIKSIDPTTGGYVSPTKPDLGDIRRIRSLPDLASRVNALFEDEGRGGEFFRRTTLDFLAYAARRIPEVTDSPADVDKAMKWGFGWEAGPFEIWDMLGFERVRSAMEQSDIAVPHWVDEMHSAGRTSFYSGHAETHAVFHPVKKHPVRDVGPEDEIRLVDVRARAGSELWRNDEAALLDLGDGVTLFEFRSKANALGQQVMQGINEAIALVEARPDLRGMVIGNEGSNFSVGANLGEAAMAMAMGQFELIERAVELFQQTVQRIRYAEKPVVVATHQRVLGGGCELAMACPHTVAAAETYIGLVELGVGLIPAGTGSTRLAQRAAELSANGHDSEIQATLLKSFNTVAMATVATSAVEGKQHGFLPPATTVVMNGERRFHVAKTRVIALADAGYLPPPRATSIRVLGRPAFAAMKAGAYQYLQGRYISEYDFELAQRFAHVLTGGDLSASQDVHEDYLLELEKEVFLGLLGNKKTQERISHILETNKPLRN